MGQDRYQSFYSNLNHVRLSSGGNTSRSSHYSRHAYDTDHYVSQEVYARNCDSNMENDLNKFSLDSNNMKKEPFPVKETKSSMQRKRMSRNKINSSWMISDSS